MIKRYLIIIFLIFLLLVISINIYDLIISNKKNRDMQRALETGLSIDQKKADILNMFGPPQRVCKYGDYVGDYINIRNGQEIRRKIHGDVFVYYLGPRVALIYFDKEGKVEELIIGSS